jgi:hypothetical protein
MIFTFNQINDIIGILRKHKLVFIAEQLGLNYLSQNEKDVLTAAGIDLTKYMNSSGIIEHAYLFGLLSEALGDNRAKNMNYQQFQKFIKSGNFIPLTEDEEFALEQLKNRAYTDLNSLGNRIATGTSNIIIKANQRQQNQLRNLVKNKTIDAVKYRQSATQLASELGHATEDWERDWLRIAYYLLHDAYNTGRAKSIFKEHGEYAEVWFTVLEGACIHCRELYLTDPDDIDSEPIVFKLKDVIANGNNIGRKADELLPTISPIHPYCFNSPATKILTSRGWKNISEINVGDLVLTHRNRFRKVTNVIKHAYNGENLYNLYYSFPGRFGKRVRCRKVGYITGNHPILTQRGWKQVDELEIKDTLYIQGLRCEKCGNIEPIGVNHILNSELGICTNCRNRESTKQQWENVDFRIYMHDKVVEEMSNRYSQMSDEERIKFTEEDIRQNGEGVFNELKNIFNNHSGNFSLIGVKLHAIQRTKKNAKCNYLYNLSVEDDESYIADGIVVHNCRCMVNHKAPNTEWDRTTRSFSKIKKYVPKNKKLQGVKLNIKIQKSEDSETQS